MNSAEATPTRQSTFDSLQAELNHFVALTERRLQSLAESMTSRGEAIHAVSYGDKVESLPVQSGPLRRGERVASTIEDHKHNDADPLSRLAAMKQRLAARIEDHNDCK